MRLFVMMGLALASLLAAGTAQAQPSSAQASAIRANCRADYERLCAAVPPGGQASLACLEQHAALLSPPCQQAVGAASGGGGTSAAASTPASSMPASAAAAAPHVPPQAPPHGALSPLPHLSPREEMFLMRESCGMDFRRLCAGVPLGGGNSLRCLANHSQSLSPRCEQALMMLHARR